MAGKERYRPQKLNSIDSCSTAVVIWQTHMLTHNFNTRDGILSSILRFLVEKSDSWTITRKAVQGQWKDLYDSVSGLLQRPELAYGE
jgi:hypothetical protein